jgi:hypothetical protein
MTKQYHSFESNLIYHSLSSPSSISFAHLSKSASLSSSSFFSLSTFFLYSLSFVAASTLKNPLSFTSSPIFSLSLFSSLPFPFPFSSRLLLSRPGLLEREDRGRVGRRVGERERGRDARGGVVGVTEEAEETDTPLLTGGEVEVEVEEDDEVEVGWD